MKTKLLNLIFVVAAFGLQSCMGTYAVVAPPDYPNETIIIAPSPSYSWVPGRYVYRSNQYVWSPGYNQITPRGKTHYERGNWNHTPKGYRYNKGRWH